LSEAVDIVEDLVLELKSSTIEEVSTEFWKTYLPQVWNLKQQRNSEVAEISLEQKIINLLSSLFYNSNDKSLFLPQDT